MLNIMFYVLVIIGVINLYAILALLGCFDADHPTEKGGVE